jgi:hypothetical protein
MRHLSCTVLASLSLLAFVAAAEAASRSALLTFPAGATELHAVFSAAQDLLERDHTIAKSVVDQRLETADTVYDSVSTIGRLRASCGSHAASRRARRRHLQVQRSS